MHPEEPILLIPTDGDDSILRRNADLILTAAHDVPSDGWEEVGTPTIRRIFRAASQTENAILVRTDTGSLEAPHGSIRSIALLRGDLQQTETIISFARNFVTFDRPPDSAAIARCLSRIHIVGNAELNAAGIGPDDTDSRQQLRRPNAPFSRIMVSILHAMSTCLPHSVSGTANPTIWHDADTDTWVLRMRQLTPMGISPAVRSDEPTAAMIPTILKLDILPDANGDMEATSAQFLAFDFQPDPMRALSSLASLKALKDRYARPGERQARP